MFLLSCRCLMNRYGLCSINHNRSYSVVAHEPTVYHPSSALGSLLTGTSHILHHYNWNIYMSFYIHLPNIHYSCSYETKFLFLFLMLALYISSVSSVPSPQCKLQHLQDFQIFFESIFFAAIAVKFVYLTTAHSFYAF